MKTPHFEFCWCGRPEGWPLCVKEKHKETGKPQPRATNKWDKIKRNSLGTMQVQAKEMKK